MTAPESDLAPTVLAALTDDLEGVVEYLRSLGVHRLEPIVQVNRIEAALDEAFTASGQAGNFEQARLMLAVCLHFFLKDEEPQG